MMAHFQPEVHAPDDSSSLYGSVRTIHHQPPRLFDQGMGPQEERLLLVLLGSCAALIGCLSLLVVCCRRYKLSGGPGWRRAGQRGWGHQLRQLPYQQFGHPPPAGFYYCYPSLYYQGGVALLDPRLLDPARAAATGAAAPSGMLVVNSAAATSSASNSAAAAPGRGPLQQQQRLQQQLALSSLSRQYSGCSGSASGRSGISDQITNSLQQPAQVQQQQQRQYQPRRQLQQQQQQNRWPLIGGASSGSEVV